MESGNDTAYAHYGNFSIDSEERHYTLSVSGYTGTAGELGKCCIFLNMCSSANYISYYNVAVFLSGDSMRYHNGRPFSTRDKDADPLGIHCARAYMGGWWYKNCYKTNLNGLYGTNSNNQVRISLQWGFKLFYLLCSNTLTRYHDFSPTQGVVWIDWKGKDSSIPFTEMKFRPSRFSPATHGWGFPSVHPEKLTSDVENPEEGGSHSLILRACDRYNDGYHYIWFNVCMQFFFSEGKYTEREVKVFNCNFLYQFLLFCLTPTSPHSLIPCCAAPCHPTTTVIKYALSHSIGIKVAVVGLKCCCFIVCSLFFPTT